MTDKRATLPKNMTDHFERIFSSDAKVEVSAFISDWEIYWVDYCTVILSPVTHHIYTLWKNDLTLLERELLK